MQSMQDHHVTALMPQSVNNIELSNHEEDDELNELEKLAGLGDKTRSDLELDISDDEGNYADEVT